MPRKSGLKVQTTHKSGKDQSVNSECGTMPDVLIIGDKTRFAEISGIIEDLKSQYVFNKKDILLEDRELNEALINCSSNILAFVEAPDDERGKESNQTWACLAELEKRGKKTLVQAFVISTCRDFSSNEAQNSWLNYSIVHGYDLLSHITPLHVRLRISAFIEKYHYLNDSSEMEIQEVGSILKMPSTEYERNKFVSLFIGGMNEVLEDVRWAVTEMKRYYPTINSHPFDKKSVAELFNGAVESLKQGKDLPKELKELKKSHQYKQKGHHLLLLGETGTGKSLLAQRLHYMRFEALRKDDKLPEWVDLIFQDINCAEISENLIESELFGSRAEAYTGLHSNYPGKIFSSMLGNLFIDEIGELPLKNQSLLLKYLDNFTTAPLGWFGERLFIPTMVIAATNQPVEKLVLEGKFRRDLYERFDMRIRIPGLCERMDHFNHLVDFVLQNPRINPDGAVTGISKKTLESLRSYAYPGNFRELEFILKQAVQKAMRDASSKILTRHIVIPAF